MPAWKIWRVFAYTAAAVTVVFGLHGLIYGDDVASALCTVLSLVTTVLGFVVWYSQRHDNDERR